MILPTKTLKMALKPPSKTLISSTFTPKITIKTHPFHLSTKPTNEFQFKPQNKKPPISKTLTLISIFQSLPNWADQIKENGMKKKRVLYDHDKWSEHRSSFRHVRHLATSLSSRVILSLIPPVLFFTSVAVFVCLYNSAVSLDLLPEFLPVLRASSLPYQLTAPALALLLVFRTEASYARFEEGRKAWTNVIAATSDFASQVIACVDDFDDGATKRSLLQYIMAFPVALKCHLLYGSDVKGDLQNFLDADDLTIVLSSKHRPHCITQLISQSLRLLNLRETERNLLEMKLSCFHDGISVCDEIMGIPIPLSYTRLTSRFLVLWHLTLPIILWDDCHWIVVPATFISAASLFCIEEVGVLIEEPFSMLALDELCKAVCSNIQEDIATQKTIQAHVTAKMKSHGIKHSTNGWPGSRG